MEGSPLSRVSEVRPGGHDLRREVVVHHQRERLLTAAIELVAERGYRAVTVADIVKRAATARAKFYENFSSKEDCFLAACDAGIGRAVSRVEAAAAGAGSALAERLDAGLRALLELIAAEPALARACFVEAPKLGAPIAVHAAVAREAFLVLLRESDGVRGDAAAEATADSVLDGLFALLYQSILSGEPARIEELRPELLEFALMPFVGPVEAHDRANALA